MLCEREPAGCKKQWKSVGLLLVIGRRIGVFGTAARRRGGLLHIVRGCVAAALRNRSPLVYMVVASKMLIEAELVTQ